MLKFFLLFLLFFFIGNSKENITINSSNIIFDINVNAINHGKWYKPTSNATWQIQLNDKNLNTNLLDINTSYDVDIYEVDLFDITKEEIKTLHDSNRKVICYFSAGSYENWRDDKSLFSSELIGKALEGWDGEYWLDISNEKLAPIMLSRLDLASSKNCDAVEFDNIDTYTQDSGFTLNAINQLAYNRFLANEARLRGLSAGLKNDLNQINDLVNYFDFIVNEQCHEYNECEKLLPFIKANKPVFNIEYKKEYVNNLNKVRDKMCIKSKKLRIYTLIMPLNLNDEFRISCD